MKKEQDLEKTLRKLRWKYRIDTVLAGILVILAIILRLAMAIGIPVVIVWICAHFMFHLI
ncbi:hypothetical protein [Lactobacillus corticis]|uniref:Uncharacterized protein n=1 Tax=Lactobacillus corticis TaxID=2201249 RepID=A0A916QG09_9LACO|nr:hypothetical protein [Lactobacillus corticis]GFZ26621.1 hypothetical protein LCB40_05010 [Lactobacillus corticis]